MEGLVLSYSYAPSLQQKLKVHSLTQHKIKMAECQQPNPRLSNPVPGELPSPRCLASVVYPPIYALSCSKDHHSSSKGFPRLEHRPCLCLSEPNVMPHLTSIGFPSPSTPRGKRQQLPGRNSPACHTDTSEHRINVSSLTIVLNSLYRTLQPGLAIPSPTP